MKILNTLALYVVILTYLAPGIFGRSHHHHHNHHHNNGKNREEAGSLPFTESKYPSDGPLSGGNRAVPGPGYAPELNSREAGFQAIPQQQRQGFQQNFQPRPEYNSNYQAFNQAPASNGRAPVAQASHEKKKGWGNHSIPFLKQIMAEMDDGKIKHHDYPALTWFLKYFAEQYPDITRLYSIGRF